MIGRGFPLASATLGVALLGTLWTSRAAACRTTTCSVTQSLPACARDPVTGCLPGPPLFWEQQCVSYSVDSRGAPSVGLDWNASEQLVSASFSLWPTAACAGGGFPSIAVSSFGPLLCHSPEYNSTGPNANGVIFYPTDWPHDPTELGVTSVSFNTETGKIFDADMEINLAGLDAIDLRYVVAHEAGHFLGMDHSPNPAALMYSRYQPFGATGAPTLNADDIGTICAAYPPGRPVGVCDFEPERGYAPDCGGDVQGSCAVRPAHPPATGSAALLVAAALFAYRVRRRRSAG